MRVLAVFFIVVLCSACASTTNKASNANKSSSHEFLLVDDYFERLKNVVVGKGVPLQPAYDSALADYKEQPDFNCRQPMYAGYFQWRYADGIAVSTCTGDVPFAVFTPYEGVKTVWLDPKRVKSIHLLFASKSGNMISRFGHVSLRLVVCPSGVNTDDACDANLAEHVVLGFQANIDDYSLDVFKAFQGKYNAYFFASQFMDVYQQYAIGEFRDLYSLPLRMSDEQRELMVRNLADIHWRYSDEYSFFTNNCATMMQKALRQTWPEFSADKSMSSDYMRPDSLYEAIKNSSLADSGRLDSLEDAERNGHYFPSTQAYYAQALKEVKAAMGQAEFANLESYLNMSPLVRRQAWQSGHVFSARLASDKHLRDAQLMLEEYALLSGERILMSAGAKYLEERDFLKNMESLRAQLSAKQFEVFDECFLDSIRQRSKPMARLNGVPDKFNVPVVGGKITRCESSDARSVLSEAISIINDKDSLSWFRVKHAARNFEDTIDNVIFLKRM